MKIIYIVGYERSGSTLLHNILSQSDQSFGVGELRHFSKRLIDERPCACGEKVKECKFWSEFTSSASEGNTYTRDKWILAYPFLKIYFNIFRRREVSYFKKLYDYAKEKSGNRIIIDSSKSLVHLFLLRKVLKYDVKVVFIVRHPKGIMHSIKRRMQENHEKYQRFNFRLLLVKIDVVNFLVNFFAKRISFTQILKYENLVRDPAKELPNILTGFGMTLDIPKKNSKGEIYFKNTHSVDGGPSRHARGLIAIKEDLSWKTSKLELANVRNSYTFRQFYRHKKAEYIT